MLRLAYQRTDEFFAGLGNRARDASFAVRDANRWLTDREAAIRLRDLQAEARRNWILALKARRAASWL
jgi:hypothetical protein